MNDGTESIWKKEWSFESGQGHFWQYGPLELWAANDGGVLVLSHRMGPDPLAETLDDSSVELAEVPIDKELYTVLRSMGQPSGFRLRPALADRGVVVRPELPTQIAPHSEAAFFMTTPIWIQVVSDKAGVLADIPTFRPSDTWFGQPAGDGELAYASRTQASPSPDRLQIRPARAMTRALFKNEADTPLVVERFNLPATALSLYRAENGRLWTESVTITNRNEFERSHIRFSSKVAEEATNAERLTGPRAEATRNLLTKAFHKLVG